MTQAHDQLKIFAIGFTEAEQRLLEAAVKLSARRKPALVLVEQAQCEAADVWLIDGHAPVDDKKWAVRTLRTLPDKVVIWVDAAKIPSNHTLMNRPVPWVNLPLILGKAIAEQTDAAQRKSREAREAKESEPFRGSDWVSSSLGGNLGGAQGKEVLIVDDSASARLHLRRLLQLRGFAVTEADSAERGLELVQAGGRFVCVLMDVMLPGMDGYEACRRLRALAGDALPVIMLTSRTSPFDRIRGSMAGCSAYLLKPADPQELHEVIAKYARLGEA